MSRWLRRIFGETRTELKFATEKWDWMREIIESDDLRGKDFILFKSGKLYKLFVDNEVQREN